MKIKKMQVLNNISFITTILIFSCSTLLNAQISLVPTEISFNYDVSSNYDAITIKENSTTYITAPEYVYPGTVKNDEFAYIAGQGNAVIKVKFNSSDNSNNYLVKATVLDGDGLGEVCEFFVAACDLNTKIFTIELDGVIPNVVGKWEFRWLWEATALPVNLSSYCPITTTSFITEHTYYTVLAEPKSPELEPRLEILNYACEWAMGENNEDNVCTGILNNGFAEHYNWNGTCYFLASDFLRLVTSLGITGTLHRWGAMNNGDIGDMERLITIPFDPVGQQYFPPEYTSYTWYFHQWAETSGIQRDPSAAISLIGDWGTYEDYLFANYKYLSALPNIFDITTNHAGHSVGCEAPEHRYYKTYPTTSTSILSTWQGPIPY